MRVVHAHWSDGALHLWAERSGGEPAVAHALRTDPANAVPHPHAATHDELAALCSSAGVSPGIPASRRVKLPSLAGLPTPSPRIAGTGTLAVESEVHATLAEFEVPTLQFPVESIGGVIEAMEDFASDEAPLDESSLDHSGGGVTDIAASASLRFFGAAARTSRHLIAQHRVVPSLIESGSGQLSGTWQPWLADGPTVERLRTLAAAMPPEARAVVDDFAHQPWPIIEDFLSKMTDAAVRNSLIADQLAEAIEGRDGSIDAHVAWLTGLLGPDRSLRIAPARVSDLARGVRRWIGLLEDRGQVSEWRLLLKLAEPLDVGGLKDLTAPASDLVWTLTIHLQSVENPRLIVDAADIWILTTSALTVGGRCIENPHELLLAELGRAARLYKPIERALQASEPSEIDLNTTEAYRFLREVRPILREQGVEVEAPAWWDSPTVRLGARLQIDSEELDVETASLRPPNGSAAGAGPSLKIGLASLVSYRWKIAVGDATLTLEQFQKLAAMHTPLVRLNGRWVEIRPEDVKSAMEFLKKNSGGRMQLSEAIRLAYGSDASETGVPILGMDATGWVGSVFGDASVNERLPMLSPPASFVGTLRPYQIKGFSWLAFLDRFGFGGCLADDMGLGKTIQLLALLAAEREHATGDAKPAPTLLIVPMSVVGNWVREAHRFTPNLRVLVHHGLDRNAGVALPHRAADADLVITTYALANRDRELLSAVTWHRVVLDEAQNIKNPTAKQTRSIRSIPAPRRVALTGTPVENRLAELWSVMDFLNPEYLGAAGEFRRKFAIPVERFHDPVRSRQLRGLVQPFLLRRLKSDPNVIADLPEKVESKEYCYLTAEQASLYERTVADMLAASEKADGIQRRGVILAGLIKLKQVCNHPAQFLREGAEDAAIAATAVAHRSGKCVRLLQMMDELIATGDRALVFTQFRQMGYILAGMLRRALDREVLFLHGGTTAKQREDMVASFQKPDSRLPVFILSLKAGGVGLNLTGANHIFHFDRWWNPAVEAQATDRAYRIGQTRTVQVHKFIVSGTLEERIDQMIESKIALADQVIGSGEEWLTEMSTEQLRDMLTLRPDAVGLENGAEDENE